MKLVNYRRSHEPVAWSLFGAGGMLLAFLGPPLLVITLLVLPLRFVGQPEEGYRALLAVAGHPLGALCLLAVLALGFFHTLHRIHHGLHDLHLPLPHWLTGLLCYGAATILSALAGWWLLQI